jgi:hypothetical protein
MAKRILFFLSDWLVHRDAIMVKMPKLAILAVMTLAFAAASSWGAPGSSSVGDEHLRMNIVREAAAPPGVEFTVEGRPFADLRSSFWAVETDEGGRSSADSADLHVSPTGDGALAASGKAKEIAWSARCERIAPGTVTVTVRLKPEKPIRIRRVFLFNGRSPEKPAVPKTRLQDTAAFYRSGGTGLFVSLDYPYSKIVERNGATALSYPPHADIKAGHEYVCHSYTVGVTRPSGRQRYGYYEGEADAFDAYVQRRFPPRFERPVNISSSIVNRYTQLENNWVYYTMKNQPTLSSRRGLLKEELRLMPKLGIEFYQVFPGVFDWGPDDPSDAQVREAMGWARENGVRMGDYSGCSVVFCPHYNQYSNSLAGTGIEPCFGNRKFVDWYAERVVSTARKFGFEEHCLDFLILNQCDNPNHGHPTGEDGIYSQVKGLCDLMERIASVSPQMLIWPNSGCWEDLMPKLAWYAPSQYLTDPYISTPWQGLNMTRLLDDSRRQQMVQLHYTHFIPYRFFTNCQYFFSQNSVVPDIRQYQYGALSSLAVTPNICLAEIRPWLDDLGERDKKEVIAFYGKWTKFIKDHFPLWKHTYHAGGDPGPGTVEIYSHAEGDRGFVFIVNPNYWGRTVELPLDKSLGFTGRGECEIKELHPWERLRLTEQGPFVKLQTKVSVEAPAQTAVVLEIRPRPQTITEPRLYGIPGEIGKGGGGYVLRTSGPQGKTERFAVLLPGGAPPVVEADTEKKIPELDRRQWGWDPTKLKLLKSGKEGALVELTYRRKAPSTELRQWSVRAGGKEEGMKANWQAGIPQAVESSFPLFAEGDAPVTTATLREGGYGPLANFCCAYLENGFSEDQNTVVYLKTGVEASPAVPEGAGLESLGNAASPTAPAAVNPLAKDRNRSWWLQGKFTTPLAQSGGCEAKFEEHTLIVLPFVDQNRVKQISAWINGQPADVQTYRYPRNRSMCCRWIDIIGTAIQPGVNNIVLQLEIE